MKRKLKYLLSIFLLGLLLPAFGQQTVGLFTYESAAFNGYTLFAPLRSNTTYLIDNCGKVVHTWQGEGSPSQSVYLLEDRTLLRTAKTGLGNPVINSGGSGERLQKLDWDGNVLWDFVYSDSTVRMHHDIEPLPNGNVLILAWEHKSAAEAFANGRNPALLETDALWPEHIVEVQQSGPATGEIVWEWHLWDHLIQDFDANKANFGVVRDHPELLDINFVPDFPSPGDPDWIHANGIDYNPELDQIVIGSPGLNELYIIDHSTTTAEAASHSGGNSGKGGDLLYRWGNPLGYEHGTAEDRQLFGQHDVSWIPAGLPDAGKLLLFNNGRGRPGGNASSVDIIEPPIDANGHYIYVQDIAYGPEKAEWSFSYPNPTDWYSSYISGAQRLPNGNTLICSGADGRFFEVTAEQEIVWEYVNPVTIQGPTPQGDPIPPFGSQAGNTVFRCLRYAPDYPGLQNADLTPGDPIEPNALPSSTDCELLTNIESINTSLLKIYPNPADDHFFIENPSTVTMHFQLYTLSGTIMLARQFSGSRERIDISRLPSGLYFLKVSNQEPVKLFIMR